MSCKHTPREQILIKTDDSRRKGGITGRVKQGVTRGEEVHVCVCVGGVIEINGARSEGAIRTMEGSKAWGWGEKESGEPVLVCRHPLSRLRDDV